jgi:hypothetical protein
VHDRHAEGLFAKSDWMRVLGGGGFDAHSIAYRHSEVDYEIALFVGIAIQCR